GVSLLCHVLAHLGAAWLAQKELPSHLSLFIFGDAAQRWRVVDPGGQELLSACAGPLLNLLLAGLGYLLWNIQSNEIIGLIALFLCGFNAWVFIINLIPAFPLDGGRIFRLLIRGLPA